MILHRTRGPDDWKAHLAQPEKHWRPGRSGQETALSGEAQPGAPSEVAALFSDARLVQAIMEYPVRLPGGDRDSFNDVFAFFADEQGLIVCMVEAKRDEPFGPTLTEWRSRPSAGRRERLEFLCRTLGLDAAVLPGDLRYQLLHRTVSAVLTARLYRTARAVMVVQSFSSEAQGFQDFSAFARVLGAQRDAAKGMLLSAPACTACTLQVGWVSAPLREGTQ